MKWHVCGWPINAVGHFIHKNKSQPMQTQSTQNLNSFKRKINNRFLISVDWSAALLRDSMKWGSEVFQEQRSVTTKYIIRMNISHFPHFLPTKSINEIDLNIIINWLLIRSDPLLMLFYFMFINWIISFVNWNWIQADCCCNVGGIDKLTLEWVND